MAALVSMFSLYNKNEMKLGWLTGQASWVPRLSNTPSRFLSRSPRSPPSSSRPRLRLPPFFPFAFTRTRMHCPSLPEKQTRGKRKQVRTKSTRATEERQQPVEMHLASKDCGKDHMHVVPQCVLLLLLLLLTLGVRHCVGDQRFRQTFQQHVNAT
jgi:hypothetical protein